MDKSRIIELVERLRGGAKYRLSWEDIRSAVSELAKLGIFQTYQLSVPLEVCRARSLRPGEIPKSLQDLGPPLAEKCTAYGRCNKPGVPVFYGALYEDTALAEIQAELGGVYVISTYTLPKGLTFLPVGDFDYYRRTGQTSTGNVYRDSSTPYKRTLETEDGLLKALVDAFFADEFRRLTIEKSDYKLTCALTDVFFKNDLKAKSPIEAVTYPSVAFQHGLNFATPLDVYESRIKQNLIPKNTEIIRVDEVFGYGLYKSRKLASLTSCINRVLSWNVIEKW